MSEDQQPQGQSGAEFDAEAAKRAKEYLEEGVTRSEDGEIMHSEDGVFENGWQYGSLNNYATMLKKQHDNSVTERDNSAKRVSGLKKDAAAYDEAKAALRESVSISDRARTLGVKSLTDRADSLRSASEDAVWDATEEEYYREENLELAEKSLRNNRAGYETLAIEEANAAGHDIDYGGHHFPATNTEQQPPQPEQSKEPQNT